jgi:RNA polymerase sigma factor (sigma-70 family)
VKRPSRLAQWFDELRQPLRRFIARRRGVTPADLDDIAQEVFLRLLRYDRHELLGEPRSYIFKIAANVANDWSARPRQRLRHDPAWLEDLQEEVEPEGEFELEQRALHVRSALSDLGPRTREIVRLHFGEGLTREAIAENLSVTPRVVKRELIRAYATLRNSLACIETRSEFASVSARLSETRRR